MSSAASTIRFSELVGLLERISKVNKTNDKQDLLKQFINQWRKYGIKDTDTFFPVMRLLLPGMDRARQSYGIREHALARLYCNLLCLGDENPDAKKLINYKLPKYNKNKAGDFSEIVYGILKERCPFKGSISIEEVNDRLDKISEADGNSRKDMLNENLMYLLQNMNALDQKWLIRIILKDLFLGMSSKFIFKSFHPSAEEFYNVTNDLEAVCVKFKEAGVEIIESFDVQLCKPFKPMLSERGDARNIISQLEGKEYIYETKFDGERVQLHKDGDMYRYWSRNGLEWTSSYGADPSWGTLTQYIHQQFMPTVRNCILDGEMMGYNALTQKMGTKAEDFDIKRPNVEELTGYSPCFIAFDVLYLNDKSILDLNLKERKRILDAEILHSELQGRIQLSKWKQASTREECIEAFNEAISNCDEGLMVKRFDSVYKVNARKAGWFKMKPDYVLGLHEELDCVVVGGYYAGSHLIHDFLCAVKSDDKFITFTKVGTGFTRKILYEYNTKMAPHWMKFNRDAVPEWLVLSGKVKDRPDLLIEPSKSYIVQLKAAEIMNSNNYATGCTLRFSRIDRFRDDKDPVMDCMTIEDLQTLRSQNKGKLALRPLEINSDEEDSILNNIETEKKQQQQLKRRSEKPQVADWLKSTVPVKKIRSTDKNSLFQGKEFCISISGSTYSKKQFEEFIFKNGGVIVQNPGKTTYAVIPDKITIKIKNLISRNNYDIIKPEWLKSCMDTQSFVQLTPSDFICMREKTQAHFNVLFDKAGDSYTDILNTDQLKQFLSNMDTRSVQYPELNHEHRSKFLDTYQLSDLPSTFLNGCVIYLSTQGEYISTNINNNHNIDLIKIQNNRIQLKLEVAGARVIGCPKRDSVTHVVLDENSPRGLREYFHMLNNARRKRFYLVSLKWCDACLSQNTRINEHAFFVSLNTNQNNNQSCEESTEEFM